MGLINFNLPKPKRFNYRPRYYDERKERLEKMKAQAEAELVAEKNRAVVSTLEKGFLTEHRTNSKLRRAALGKSSWLRVLVILLGLLGVWRILLPELFKVFWRLK
jgi:hypothetical protein